MEITSIVGLVFVCKNKLLKIMKQQVEMVVIPEEQVQDQMIR